MTRLFDLVTEDDLARGMADKLIAVRDADDRQSIYNYTDAAIYTPGAWDNPAVRVCRGLIIDPEGFVVARPWAKFFNHGQAEAGELDLFAPVEVTDKLDGSLGIIHVAEDGSTRVATRGSFQSDQAIHATEWIQSRPWRLDDTYGWTPLVEIIYPANRIVCDYGDRDELVLLGAVHIESGLYVGPRDAVSVTGWPYNTAETFEYGTLHEAIAAAPRPGAEGLCVRYRLGSHIVKIKQDDYVRLHRIVTGLSERSVWEAMTDGLSLHDVLADLPDELHGWTIGVWERLEDAVYDTAFNAVLAHKAIVASLGGPLGDWTRKEYADQAQRSQYRPYLFMLLDGKRPHDAILKSLKPAGDTRAKAYSEAVA